MIHFIGQYYVPCLLLASALLFPMFLGGHSMSLFHPSDFLNSYEIIICFIYLLIIADHVRNVTERMYFVFYYHIIKGILIVFMDPSSIVETCNESEIVIIKTWTGRKYRGHSTSLSLSIFFFEFENVKNV
ncbi:hypothetical protein L5515_005832 [Caenorhabditis briggsae]|uniref:Uncharacterized protein n=1 Tax=Caenorhabditis briggsae TaxID=6238 RepID=A0AAE9F2W6_CAEBR|nr:hypothetical protein L5515_005832 [Caenorhabditis briggsae]